MSLSNQVSNLAAASYEFDESSSLSLLPPELTLPPPGRWLDLYIPKSFRPTYFPPTRFVVRCLHFKTDWKALLREMNSFYSIAHFTKDIRDRRGIIGDDRLVKGALFAAYVKDIRGWARIIFKERLGKELVVYLPDHGFYSSVKLNLIWDLEMKFKSLPFQAFVASLPLRSPSLTGRWSDEAVHVFKEAVTNKNLIARISSVKRDESVFPKISVEFSSLFAPSSASPSSSSIAEEKSWNPKEDDEFPDAVENQEKSFSVVDLMVEKCHAKIQMAEQTQQSF